LIITLTKNSDGIIVASFKLYITTTTNKLLYSIFGIKNIGTVSKEESHSNLDKILVVDDERDICRMISNILKEEGYKVDKAYDGEQAIRKIKARGYNLMLLDYKLPDIDGINVLKEIRRIEPSLNIIMISAYGSPSIKSTAKKLGAYRFLDKPFDLNRLIKIVKDALTEKVRAKS